MSELPIPTPVDPRFGRQLSIEEVAAADRLATEEAIERVDAAAPAAWKDEALDAVRTLARGGGRFTTDDVWDALAYLGVAKPREPRALGPVMRRAEREGTVRWTGTFAESRRRHRTPVRIWEAA